MATITRREFAEQSLGSLLTFTLLETLFRADAFAAEVKPMTARWLADVNELGQDVKAEKLPQLEWQKKIEELFAKVDLPDLLRLIDFDKLTANVKYLDRGALSLPFGFAEVEGVPKKLVFGKQIFALKKDRSVIPHGHSNMATAFLILSGEFEGRLYDRLGEEPGHFIIWPTTDRQFAVGECSTISDYKDNVHWFKSTSETAYIFNIHVLDVNRKGSLPTGRLYLDPDGEKLADGTVRAPRISYAEANRRYG